MNFEIYQIIVILITIIFLGKAISHFLRKEQTIRETITVFAFWIGVNVFTLFPDTFDKVISYLGFSDYINAIIFFALVVLFYIVFQLILAIDNLQKEISRLVRALALKDDKEKKDS